VNETGVAEGGQKPAATFPYPVERIAFKRTVRLVTTARLRDPVLLKLVGEEFFDDLAEIEGATSGRLTAEKHGADKIKANEFVAGPPHAAFINAAFAYWRPLELNRFNGPGRGAWYAALKVETCIEEVAFHMMRELVRVNDFNAIVEYAEMFASLAGEFVDLRRVAPTPVCLNPDPAVGYPEGNRLAESVRGAGYNGVIYPSVRHKVGTCIVVLWPQAVQSVVQGRVLRLTWSGRRQPTVSIA
jgi:RES domain-containing protein